VKDFIGFIKPIVFINQDEYAPDPVPPGPYDRQIPAADGLVSYTTPYNSPTGSMIVRIVGRNNAASAPGIAVTWNGVPLTVAAEVHDSTSGHAFAWMGGIKGGATGTHNLVITATGSAGFAALRIGDVVTYDSFGAVQSQIGAEGLFDIAITPQTPGASDLAQMCGWIDDRAYPVSQWYDAIEQWQTYQVTTGPELVVNGDFASAAGWTLGTGWSITGGQAVHTGNFGNLLRAFAITEGRYLSAYDVVSITTPNVVVSTWRYGTGQSQASGPQRTAPGSYSQVVQTPGPVNGYGVATSVGPSVVDNLSLKAITGGMTAWFGRQPTYGATMNVTYEAANYNDNPQGVALAVEIKGLVQV
jgi:hypothetical protein